MTSASGDAPLAADSAWNAEAMGCGELVMELRFRLQALPAGALLLLTATDPGAPEDLPAWCAMTGHRLIECDPPHYWIRKKEL